MKIVGQNYIGKFRKSYAPVLLLGSGAVKSPGDFEIADFFYEKSIGSLLCIHTIHNTCMNYKMDLIKKSLKKP